MLRDRKTKLAYGVGASGTILAVVLLVAPALGQDAKEPILRRQLQLNPQLLRQIRPLTLTPTVPAATGQAAPEAIAETVTLELRDATVRDAAVALARATGILITVPTPDPGVAASQAALDPTQPKLDETRKASFTWKDAPLSQALRDFCRGYACTFYRDHRGNLTVAPGPLPTGPSVKVPGFVLEVGRISFSDYRSAGEEVADATPRRSLGLQLQIRAEGVDPATLLGLENLRVLDQDGRDVLDQLTQVAAGGAGGRTQATAFPDERTQQFTFDWPYPAPRKLKLIEGDVVVSRSIKRSVLELPIPPAGEQSILQVGESQFQFVQNTYNGGNSAVSLQIQQPPTLDLQSSYGRPHVRMVLEHGTTVTGNASINYWNTQDGWTSGYASVNAQGLKSKPVKLLWSVVTKSDQTRRHRFRFENYPALLGGGDAAPVKAPVPKPKPAVQGARPNGAGKPGSRRS